MTRRPKKRRTLAPVEESRLVAAWRKGARQMDLARKFRVSQPTVSRILRRRMHATPRLAVKPGKETK